MQIMTVDKVNQ